LFIDSKMNNCYFVGLALQIQKLIEDFKVFLLTYQHLRSLKGIFSLLQ